MNDRDSIRERDAHIERQIRAAIAHFDGRRLPSVHDWARQLGTGTARVSRVLRILKSEGVLDFSPRRRARFATTEEHVPVRAREKTETVYEHIRGAIEDGRYPSGTRLPKAEFFAAETRVCANTVRRALARLVRDRIAYRERQAIRVGPVPESFRSGAEGPVILMLQAIENWWEQTLSSDWIAPFSRGFMREVNVSGTQVVPVFLREFSTPFLAHGYRQIAALAKSLGPRFRGTLMLGQSWDFRNGSDVNVLETAERLLALERPVVWFDLIDEIQRGWVDFDTDRYRSLASTPRARRLFSRVYPDNDAAMTLALRELFERGHRRVGLPWFDGDGPELHDTRIDGLIRLSQRFAGMDLVECRASGDPFGSDIVSAPGPLKQSWLVRLTREGRASLDKALSAADDSPYRRVAALAPVLMELLFDHGATAIIAPNDLRAREYYLALRTIGLEMPRDVSLVSFDANPRLLHPWQISSVDFGFVNLSYCAYHLIMGDVPVRRRGCEVAARCRINHAGSLGAPTTR